MSNKEKNNNRDDIKKEESMEKGSDFSAISKEIEASIEKEQLKKNNKHKEDNQPKKQSKKEKREEKLVKQEDVRKEAAEKESPQKESIAPNTVVEGSGINLIPSMSEEEIKTSERKKKINVTSLVSVSLLLSISILVVGFNIVSKIQLDAQKKKLTDQERTIQGYSELISGNTEILERVFLYQDVQEGRFSPKRVIDHFRNQISKTGGSTLDSFLFPGTKGFEFSGKSQSLEDVAKLWYLMVNDEKIEEVELRTLSKGSEGANFSFRGTLVIEEFMPQISE
jgi:hypothetical protein